jgi:8-oxo-dGTP pyrophosphatase MutT (NUDIX family)
MADKPVAPSPASTLIVVRAGADAPEILLMKRHARSRFMPEAYVFAGGSLDAADAGERMYGLCANLRDARASEILGVPRDGLQFFVAAVRECFEECGILFAYDCENRLIGAGARQVHQLQHMRAELHVCRLDLGALCAAQGWHLAVDQLIYFSHWITPIERPRRFDTRFFVAAAPVGQEGSLAGEEMSDLVWLSAARALEEHAAERLQLRLPTRTILEELARFENLSGLFEFVRKRREIAPILPQLQ